MSGPLPPLLAGALADPRATDFCFSSDSLAVDRGRGMELLPGFAWPEGELKLWLLQELSRIGRAFDAKAPYVDGTLGIALPSEAADGAGNGARETPFRLHALFPPLHPRILVSLRRLPEARETRVWAADPAFARVAERVRAGDSVIIAGSTGSGKTTLLNELLADVAGSERILALEDTPELSPLHPQFFSLQSRPPNADGFGEVTLRTLLKQTLRMRPDRIILGECRGAEVLDLLQALNTGHRGTLATLHAHSPRDALRRMELLCLLSSGGVLTTAVIRDLLAVGIQWLVQVERTSAGRRICEVSQVAGKEGETVLLRPTYSAKAAASDAPRAATKAGFAAFASEKSAMRPA